MLVRLGASGLFRSLLSPRLASSFCTLSVLSISSVNSSRNHGVSITYGIAHYHSVKSTVESISTMRGSDKYNCFEQSAMRRSREDVDWQIVFHLAGYGIA